MEKYDSFYSDYFIMNTENNPHLRMYIATIIRSGKIPLLKWVHAIDRAQGVYKIEQWFWNKYRNTNPINKTITVSDNYNEVHYGPKFDCGSRLNKLLPFVVIERLIAESKGELIPETHMTKRHGQKNSVRRVKRRRDFGKFIAPCVKLMKSGTMYYRIITAPQRSHHGRRYRKRKYRDVRLQAQTLETALNEIKDRQLDLLHSKCTARNVKVRDLTFTAYVAGLIDMEPKLRSYFYKVLPRYEEPRTIIKCSSIVAVP